MYVNSLCRTTLNLIIKPTQELKLHIFQSRKDMYLGTFIACLNFDYLQQIKTINYAIISYNIILKTSLLAMYFILIEI